MLSKNEEIELLDRIIAGCPVGYVRDILVNEREDFIIAIKNDFGFISFSQTFKMVEDARKELTDANNSLRISKEELMRHERMLERVKDEIGEIRLQAKRLSCIS
jgi:hypothetical protein